MALVVSVPLNTMLADLDETLRALLKRELERHGFDGVEVAFDAPAREWSGQLSAPTVNLFLYDLRESQDARPVEWRHVRGQNGSSRDVRPPMIMECSYAVTAWTQAVEDEHRLLSQVLAVLFAFPQLPEDILQGRLAAMTATHTISGKVGAAKSDGKADFWSAVGGQYKASLDYVAQLACEAGTVSERGQEVRTQSMTTQLKDGPASTILELHRFGGTIADGEGAPVANAWITIPSLGLWTASRADGRFIFDRVAPGEHEIVARTVAGDEISETARIPGSRIDLVVGEKAKAKRK